MLGAVLSFAAMAIALRELQRHMGTLQILALRTGMTLAIVAVLVTAHRHALIATQRARSCNSWASTAPSARSPPCSPSSSRCPSGRRSSQRASSASARPRAAAGARSPLADGQRRSVDALQAAQRHESSGSGNSQRNYLLILQIADVAAYIGLRKRRMKE